MGDEGPPLLLLHGFGTNGYTWNRWAPELARDHRVFLVELMGFGSAPKPRDGDYSPFQQALLVHRFILQQDLRNLVLVGHSLGGGIAALAALRLQAQAPGRLTRLVLVAGAALPQPLSPFIRMAARPLLGPLLLRLLPARFIVRQALKLAYDQPGRIRRSQVEAYAEPLLSGQGRRALSRTARALPKAPERGETEEKLGRLSVPTLLLWGANDRIVPPALGRRLEGILPDARLEILEGCGHMPHEELPEASLDQVRAFLSEG